MQVLSRRTKNNPVLIGDPGVGKTAIVEGLARRVISGDVPDSLKNKRIIAMDIGAMDQGRAAISNMKQTAASDARRPRAGSPLLSGSMGVLPVSVGRRVCGSMPTCGCTWPTAAPTARARGCWPRASARSSAKPSAMPSRRPSRPTRRRCTCGRAAPRWRAISATRATSSGSKAWRPTNACSC